MIVAIAPRRMGRSAVDTIVSQAGGNPLFVAELVRDAMAIEKSILPPTIALLAKNRLDLLAPGALRIIEACSVVGITFRVADISAITTAAKHEVLAALRAARDIGLLLEHDHPDEFAFTHGLFRSAVYERMLVAERIPMHLSLAKHLESAGERARDLATLAYHWRQAGERRRAADFAIRAGDAAMQIGAYSSARDCYLEALADGIDDSLASAEVEERLARALDRAGDSHTAVRYFKMASEDRAAYGDARGALATLLEFASASHRAGDADAMAKACNIVLSDSDDSALVVRARSLLAMHHVLRNELDAGQAHIDASESIAGPRDARDELTLRWAGAQIAHYRNEDSWSTQAREALQIAERSNDAGLLAYTLMNFGAMSRTSGRDQDAIEAWDRAIDLADNNGLLFASSYARSQKVQALHFRGHLDQAYRLAVENAGLHVDAVMARIYCASSTLDLLADMDRLDDLPMLERSDLLEEAFATGEDGHFASLTAAHVNALVVRNTMDQVPALIRRAIEATTTFAYTSHALVTFARFGGAEDVARAEALRGPLSRSGTQRLHHFTIGAIGALRRGERSESRRLVRTAMDLARQLEAPLYLGLLHELVGERDEAIGLYERVGAAGQIRILSGKRQKQLTSRERQVADLIARGRTNRDIARELALSERTVEHHAAAIYAKLGFETRAAFIAAGSLLHAGTSKRR
jgi:DNA-binding NarL/FixJ family response regulator